MSHSPQTPAIRAALEAEIVDLETQREGAILAANECLALQKPTMTAHLQALRLSRELGADIAAKRERLAAMGNDLGLLTEEEFLGRLELSAARMPDQHLEVFVKEYEQRHRFSVVQTAPGVQ